jgi:competence ComEA-like helix-hairpin-helix protein
VKHDLPSAKAGALIAFLLSALTLCASACATLPQRVSVDAQLDLNNSSKTSAAPLNINLASVSELERLPGVGKVIAERIVTYRLENGPFRRAEHLMMVRGISDSKFRALRSLIVAD